MKYKNNIFRNLSFFSIALFTLASCTNNVENKNVEQVDSSTTKNYSLAGTSIIVTYPQMQAEIAYTSDSTLHWKTKLVDNSIAEGNESISYKQVGDSLFFVNWIEKDGETISQIVDFKKKTVTVFLSTHDENSDRGQRSSAFFEGKLELKN